jgi:hypothetical protein
VEEEMMRTVSWILLTVVALMVALGGAASMMIAYFAPASNDLIVGSTNLDDLGVSDEVATALRGRRGTAAAYALGFASFMFWVVLGPYRKGSVWAWWALFCSAAVLAVPLVLRIPALGYRQGAMVGVAFLIVVVLGLLLDVRRLSAGS